MKFDSIMEAAEQAEMNVPEGWGQGRATFGGLVGAILIRHMQTALGAQTALDTQAAPLRSFSLSFVAPMAPGPLALDLQVLRSGKSVTQVQVNASQEGQVVAVMLASLGHPRTSAFQVEAAPAPRLKAPEACLKMPYLEGVTPSFLQHFNLYYTGTNLPCSGASQPDFEGYMRFTEASRFQDAATLACLVDAWPSSMIPMLRAPAPMSSLTWTMEYLVDPATLPRVDHWQYDVVTDAFADGYGQSRARIWDDSGRPVAFSRQTTVLFA